MIVVYILLGLILFLLLGASLMPKHYNVEKSIVINKAASLVKEYVGNLNHFAAWNPWQQMDPGATKEISGSPSMPGHRYGWNGKKIGIGSLTLKNLDEKHISFDLEFLKPWKSKAADNWVFEPWGDGSETKVTWANNGDLPWPIARLMGPMITKNLNHQFEKGLENLKKAVEGGS